MSDFITEVGVGVTANLISAPISALIGGAAGILLGRARLPRAVSRLGDSSAPQTTETELSPPLVTQSTPGAEGQGPRASSLDPLVKDREAKIAARGSTPGPEISVPLAVVLGLVAMAYGLLTMPGLLILIFFWAVGLLVGTAYTSRAAARGLIQKRLIRQPMVITSIGAIGAAGLAVAVGNFSFKGISVSYLWALASAVPVAAPSEAETPLATAMRYLLHPVNGLTAAVTNQEAFIVMVIAVFTLALALAMLFWISSDVIRWRGRIEYELGVRTPRVVNRAVMFEISTRNVWSAASPWYPIGLGILGVLVLVAPEITLWLTTKG